MKAKQVLRILIVLWVAIGFMPRPDLTAAETSRTTVFISDLHFGVGKNGDVWDPHEDFRWGDDLKAFLDSLTSTGKGETDLVILGDLLELWQPRKDCVSKDPDWGCTIDEMETIVKDVIAAHGVDLKLLASFARNGSNRMFIVPGNHDAALLLPSVWALISKEMGIKDGDPITLVRSGVWTSDDGTVVAEHGHQIGGDVNLYPQWPMLTSETGGDKLRRPWGEHFVQELYNEREECFPLIDNLSPESAGVRYYMADKGVWGSAQDAARFIWFNLFETSLYQKMRVLGPQKKGEEFKFNTDKGRLLGYKLFAGGFPSKDTFREKLLNDKDPLWEGLRTSLQQLAKDKAALPDDQVKLLCAHLAAQKGENPPTWTCVEPKLGALIEHTLVPKEWVMRAHLNQRLAEHPRMRTFVYAHTHELWFDWTVQIQNGVAVKVYNTGAFQRLIADEAFQALAKENGITPMQAMKSLPFDKLPACYSGVHISSEGTTTVKNWYRGGAGNGTYLSACDEKCSNVSRKCLERTQN